MPLSSTPVPSSEEVQAEHAKEIETSRNMLSKLANAKLHAGNELQRWVLSCNRFIWGEVPAELRQPSPEEIAWLLGQLPAEAHERVMKIAACGGAAPSGCAAGSGRSRGAGADGSGARGGGPYRGRNAGAT